MERGKKGARLHIESLVGDLADALGHAKAMERLRREGLEDEEVECALQEIGFLCFHLFLLSVYMSKADVPIECQQEKARPRRAGRSGHACPT